MGRSRERGPVIFEWIEQNSTFVQASVGIVTALVWVVYLQLLLYNVRRQRKTDILINLYGATGGRARCFVSNLGLEPIYLLEILVTMHRGGEPVIATVTDRAELAPEDLNAPKEATNQGPLKSGDFVDVGSIEDIVHRAQLHTGAELCLGDLDRVKITVAATTSSTSYLVAAEREYVILDDDGTDLMPTALYARQLSLLGRYRLKRLLMKRFRDIQEPA